MNIEDKEALKKELLQKKQELEELIIGLKEETKPQGLDNAIGRVSRMDYINNKAVREQGLRKAEQDMKAIERWLDLYEDERFGRCIRCKNPINPRRLLFLPSSTLCIHCASR